MVDGELIAALTPVTVALDDLGVAYYVTGSVLSSHLGHARSTVDADLVADLRPEHAARLVAALEASFYIDIGAVDEAIRRRGMFNAVHLETMLKVDVYATSTAFDRETLSRARPGTFADGARAFSLATAEDLVVHKLIWFRAGGGVSERQWRDVVGVLRVQVGRLDLVHMRAWAQKLGVDELLDRALAEAAL